MPLLAGLGAGCVLAAVIFGIVYLGGWGPFARTPKDSVQVAQTPSPVATPRTASSAETAPSPPVIEERSEPAAPTPAPTPAPPALVQVPRPKPAPAQTAPPVTETPAARPEPPLTTEEARLAPPPVPTPTPAPVPTIPAPAAISGGLEDGKTYVNEVPIPGGGVVKLNGIAFSPDHPIAVFDGRVVAPGEVVQGFTVLEIQADHVTLQGHGAKVSVSLK